MFTEMQRRFEKRKEKVYHDGRSRSRGSAHVKWGQFCNRLMEGDTETITQIWRSTKSDRISTISSSGNYKRRSISNLIDKLN